jgi:threonylcarbamoyladenosine tRNA methylthiotransferase MtaB
MKVFLDTVGCKLNQSEIERYATQFHAAGHQLVRSMDEAEIAIINTCAVTAAAAQDSRQKLRQAIRKNPQIRLVATGCLASLDDDLKQVIPELDTIIPNYQKDYLVETILGESTQEPAQYRVPVSGNRRRTRAFIKCQDGCNHYCTFCITRIARGKSRSIPLYQIQNDIELAVRAGAKEIVLTGVQLGSWGKDQNPPTTLRYLLDSILAICPSDLRVRVSSIEPWDVDDNLLNAWQDPRLCQHFHLPLQSGSDRILKLMGRRTSQADFAGLIGKIRELYPLAAVTTDMIAGFPGETVADFQDTVVFLQQLQLTGGHAFSYSARQGTPAAQFPEQVNGTERHRRSNILRDLFAQMGRLYREKWVGQQVQVLWESTKADADGWLLGGWTEEYIRVEALSPVRIWNEISKVLIEKATDEGCSGKIS